MSQSDGLAIRQLYAASPWTGIHLKMLVPPTTSRQIEVSNKTLLFRRIMARPSYGLDIFDSGMMMCSKSSGCKLVSNV